MAKLKSSRDSRTRKDWIEHDLFVETEFDTDGDGKPDRMHVSVSRQKQTETEGLKVPVVYVTSPYFAGVSGTNKAYFWNPEHELNAQPPERKNPPPIKHQSRRPDHLAIPFERVDSPRLRRGPLLFPGHRASPRAAQRSVARMNRSPPRPWSTGFVDAPKVITSLDGDEEVTADWCTGKVGMTGTSYNGTLPLACGHHRCRRTGSDHPNRPQHVVLPLLPLPRPGPTPGWLHGRRYRCPV